MRNREAVIAMQRAGFHGKGCQNEPGPASFRVTLSASLPGRSLPYPWPERNISGTKNERS